MTILWIIIGVGIAWHWEQRRENKERVDRLTWYAYLSSASGPEEASARYKQFLKYSKTAKWT